MPTVPIKGADNVTYDFPLNTDPATAANQLATIAALAATLTVRKAQQFVTDCIISNTASLSAAVDLGVFRLVGISIPATFEPTTITFQASYDGTTWNNVYDYAGVEKAVTVGVSRRIILNPADFIGIRHLKIRGGTSGSPTNVAADRTLKLIAEG